MVNYQLNYHPLDYKIDDRLKIYPDKPKFVDSIEALGMVASRTDQYAMIGMEAGEIELPGIELPWWDIADREWKLQLYLPEKL